MKTLQKEINRGIQGIAQKEADSRAYISELRAHIGGAAQTLITEIIPIKTEKRAELASKTAQMADAIIADAYDTTAESLCSILQSKHSIPVVPSDLPPHIVHHFMREIYPMETAMEKMFSNILDSVSKAQNRAVRK